MKNKHSTRTADRQNEFISLIRLNSHRHRLPKVFMDFCEMAAISMRNAVDLRGRNEREIRFREIRSKYTPEETTRFAQMLVHVVQALTIDFHDCLGELYMLLDLGNRGGGQ